MHCKISIEEKIDDVLLFVLNKLPKEIRTSIFTFIQGSGATQISEIRLHKNNCVNLIGDSKNIRTNIYLSGKDLDEILTLLCDGSVYAHFDTMKEGYISLGNGIRAGICGRAVTENGKVVAISEATAINIRLPKRIPHAGDYLFNILEKNSFNKSIILYSRPGVGKTSILRELLCLLSSYKMPIRHAVIDSREEITPFLDPRLLSSDIFIGYPKGLGIEIATRSMTPELIICDEITSLHEASAILSSSNCGVKLIATAHASSFEELCSKEILQGLFAHKVFDFALGVDRKVGSKIYNFTLNELWLSFWVVF